MSLACDKWRTVAENIRALQLTVEAMRGINRWGSSELMERSFTGFTALPAPQEEHWWDILLVRRDSPLDVIESNYRSLAKEHHPDRGGSSEKFVKITKAVEQARKEKQQ
jgi:DnaJ-domain-containing protein 1